MDDIITVVKSDQMSAFHDHLNSVNSHIQFTMEVESDGSLPFLDVLLEREPDGSVVTSVYRKPTATDKYLSFNSHHPLTHKRSVVRTLYCRANAISSSLVQRASEESMPYDRMATQGSLLRDVSIQYLQHLLRQNPLLILHYPTLGGLLNLCVAS